MIQEYLNEQFIQTTEDANFEKLKKTCADIAKKIGKDKIKILVYSLIAFDPEIPSDNKEIVEIKNQIIEAWQTFMPNSGDTHLTIIRAVMLESLKSISQDNNVNAGIIWWGVRNAFKNFNLGREEIILTNFLIEIGNKIEIEATENWNFDPDYESTIPKVSAAVLDDSDFSAGFTAPIVKEAVNKALKAQIKELKENQKEFADQIALMQMRNQLLWWKEAAYSPLKKSSYKNMKKGQLHVLLAFDYSIFIPDIYPVSVDYFLIETLKNLTADASEKTRISDFIKLVEEYNSDLKNVIPEFSSADERISFATFINGLVRGKYRSDQFKSLVGVSDSIELTLAEITLWIFHDLHSLKLSSGK